MLCRRLTSALVSRRARAAPRLVVARCFSSAPSSDSNHEEKRKPTVLCILDGWGHTDEHPETNAVRLAHTPNFDRLVEQYPSALLQASEEAVGLPAGQFGNSEVGHMNIGAGRVIYQDILRIRNAFDDGSILQSPALLQHVEKLKESGGTCHVLGLVSAGGVHGMREYLAGVANVVHGHKVPVKVHLFTDGRDTPPRDAIKSMPAFLGMLDEGVDVATVTGRYYAMDRDTRWDRVGQAYDAIVSAKTSTEAVKHPMEAVEDAYGLDITDEFIQPTVIEGYQGMQDGDGVLMTNFRSDRAREIMQFLADPKAPSEIPEMEFGSEARPRQIEFADVCGMVEYSSKHNEYMSSIFAPKDIAEPFGAVVSKAGLRQLRCAETEKYPHVTFFFNGGVETVYEGEDRLLIDSPRDVATYDEKPEMSAYEVRDKLCAAVDSGVYDTVVVNFANPDMVGHTGSIPAAVAACEAVDECLGALDASVQKLEGNLLVTADHGNCEVMVDHTTGEPHPAHTTNLVPVVLAQYGSSNDIKLKDGKLADLVPTMLQLMKLEKPSVMDGESLIVEE